MTDKQASKHRVGLSIRRLNLAMAFVILVISIALLFATFSAKSGYSRMRDNTDVYIRWEKNANDLQLASDYLTEQVRCFVETGKREYLDNYFEEADVTQRREKALESILQFVGDSQAYRSLESAMAESVMLMEREYYAMRLTIAAYGYDYTEFPEAIQKVELSETDALLSRARQGELARTKVFDDVYHKRKDTISRHVQACLDKLAEEIDDEQYTTADRLDAMLFQQRVLIIAAILVTLFTMLLTMLLVISPLLHAVMYIRADQPIPIRGSNEFRFLAKTYNLMYEANHEQKEQLAYDATHDKLTGLYNRSGYDFFLKNTNWETSCLLLFDVDKYKRVNDTYGHETGDRILKKVASVIRESFRAQDYACRIGGDEFAVIMVHTSPDHAQMVRDKVERINAALSRTEDGLPAVHISCGAAYGAHNDDAADIFRQADAALYRVKGDGGNGCEVYLG